MKLALAISLSHAGLDVPPELAGNHLLSSEDIARDGDEQAEQIYGRLRAGAGAVIETPIARAFVDVNRAPDDRRKDGVVKTHTCWDVVIYKERLTDETIQRLLDRYHRPYHAKLSQASAAGVVAGVDCHTMAAQGPPVGPDSGRERPAACVSNAEGTCPEGWLTSLARCLQEALGQPVAVNDPFKGGYIIREHAPEMPWVQLEISRGDFMSAAAKGRGVEEALRNWSRRVAREKKP